MTTPAWLCQVRDLRTAIAADGLTVEGALAQAAADPNLSLFAQDLLRTLLAYTDAEFDAFADYDNPDLRRAGKTLMGERFMRAAMAAPVEYVYYYGDEHRPPRSDAAPATPGQVMFWSEGELVTGTVPRLNPKELAQSYELDRAVYPGGKAPKRL